MEGIDVIGEYLNQEEAPKEPAKSEIIKIIGVGGAGCNAVNNVYKMGVPGVSLVVCNTDKQALDDSPVSCKIQLGKTVADGLGAGNNPEKGRESAIEAKEDIEKVLRDNTKMIFVAAGMGGGTGTGAAPVIAEQAKGMGILTIGIVTIPQSSEGKPRLRQAIKGAEELSKHVDSLLVVNTDRIFEIYQGQEMDFEDALSIGDNVMALAAKGLAEMISRHRRVNVDFADVKGAMTNSGCSLMGTAEAEGPNRAEEAVNAALESPLLNNNDISGATHVLLNISSSPTKPMTLDEQKLILDTVNERAGGDDNDRFQVIWGAGKDTSVEEGKIRITVVATGFSDNVFATQPNNKAVEVDLTRKKSEAKSGEDEDDEKSPTYSFKDPEKEHYDSIVNNVYHNKGGYSAKQDFDTTKLADATCIPLSMLTEEVLNNIEQVPAYKRRANEA